MKISEEQRAIIANLTLLESAKEIIQSINAIGYDDSGVLSLDHIRVTQQLDNMIEKAEARADEITVEEEDYNGI